MKKAYKYLVCMTVTVIFISVLLVQMNGQMHEYEQPYIFIAQYSLFNIYMQVIAYMYSPCTSTKFSKPKKTDESQERDVIMNVFYETELPELGEYTEISRTSSKTSNNVTSLYEQNRRDMKKDPQEKVKERLWESIVSATEISSGSDDEDG